MSSMPNPFQRAQPFQLDYGQQIEAGVLARFFNSVYAWMAAGLGLTAAVAMWVSSNPEIIVRLYGSGFVWLLFIGQLALVWTVAGAVNRISATTATVLFLIYAALNGLTLSVILLVYAKAVIASAFVITAAMFGAMSLYGFVTKRDLTRVGALAFMALIGIIIASVVSIFWHPTMLTVAINYLGVLVFVALTAYDTQRLKVLAIQTQGDPAMAARLSISGALALYLDFLNLFLFIVSILGNDNRRR